MNIIVNGAAGRMGQQVCRLVEAEGHTLAAAVDRSGGEGFVSSLAEYTGPADVVIDFSNHAGVGELVDYCVSRGLPLVAATTGYTPEEFAKLEAGAKKIAIFQSYNMSVGVALLARLVNWFFQHYYSIAFHGILGFVLASTLVIVPTAYSSGLEILLSAVCCAGGFALAFFLARLERRIQTSP